MKDASDTQLIDEILDLARWPGDRIPARTRRMAELSLLDWMACGLAGIDEPLAGKLRALVAEEGGRGSASVLGAGRAPARAASLVNGATSHALDYDDTHFAHVGHLSVGIYPAALAAGEEMGASAADVVDAFAIGAECAIRIGRVLGAAHYNLGFHQTATAGAFGATVAAGRVYGLGAEQMRAAIGLCSTRASGLKSQFGTMGKPYNAGIAATNGVECAKLALFGMTSADDGLMGAQGFVPTHTPRIDTEAGWLPAPDRQFLFEDNKYKLHACCHGTHAMIEALTGAAALKGNSLREVRSFALRTNPRWLRVCDLKAPRTGLEVKFSYVWLAGMALRGDVTGDGRIYTDALAADPELADFAARVSVRDDESLTDMQAQGIVTMSDGTEIAVSHDLAAPVPEEMLASKLRAKTEALLGAAGADLWERFGRLYGQDAHALGAALRRQD